MKKIILLLLLLGLLLAAVTGWFLLGSGTAFSDSKTYIFVKTNKADKKSVMEFIRKNNLLKHPYIFEKLANQMNVWQKIKPGRFEVKNGESLLTIARTLKNNKQSPVRLVINKIRTNNDLAILLGRNFEADSSEVLQLINTPDSLGNRSKTPWRSWTALNETSSRLRA